MHTTSLAGVYVAAVTPLNPDYSPALEDIPHLLSFLAGRGCHGALILGTTGEGPSFAYNERLTIFESAAKVREVHPEFKLLAGTGTPSLVESSQLTKAAFDLGFDGVVVVPPYYFRKASDDGLFVWFSELIQRGVPSDGAVFGYHIPAVSGVPLSLDLLSRLQNAFPGRFAGIKDSSGDPNHTLNLGERFQDSLVNFVGNDRLFSLALESHGSGGITALANLCSPDLRAIWDSHQQGAGEHPAQKRLDAARTVLDRYPPFAPTLKTLLAHFYGFPRWPVRPPLEGLSEEIAEKAITDMAEVISDLLETS
jgi:4-hydroxy-tetrahydrodipicolinate synthase